MITVKTKGDFKNTDRFLNNALRLDLRVILQRYGEIGVDALSKATPVRSGLTAQSWVYDIGGDRKHCWITWGNTNVVDGVSVAILLQYDHGTGTGGFIRGIDYINPAMRPVFEQISRDLREEVARL